MLIRIPHCISGLVCIAAMLLPGLSLAGDPSKAGSVTFAFDGGTLLCTFGTKNREARPHTATIVYPTSVGAFQERTGLTLKLIGRAAVVVVTGDDGKPAQLTPETVGRWSRSRVAEMAGRRTSTAENSVVSTVVHSLTNDLPVLLWASNAQDALESGNWCKLFDANLSDRTVDPFADPFGGDPFK